MRRYLLAVLVVVTACSTEPEQAEVVLTSANTVASSTTTATITTTSESSTKNPATTSTVGTTAAEVHVVLDPEVESWWCESIEEAINLGWSPSEYAAAFRAAFESGASNAPVSDLDGASRFLGVVMCRADFAREAAAFL